MNLLGILLKVLVALSYPPIDEVKTPAAAVPSWPRPLFPPPPPPDPAVPKAQFIGPRVAVPGDSACQVCGEALKGGLVACPSCATLSHESCWTYARGCSTYGCDVRG